MQFLIIIAIIVAGGIIRTTTMREMLTTFGIIIGLELIALYFVLAMNHGLH
jgi:hypothetical protein